MAADSQLEPGDDAPDFSLPTLSGETVVRLADQRGQTVLLFFVREFS